jgi:hypothetical protein
MSYILDALTKAAQQRDRQVPVVQRLLAPAPRTRSWSVVSGRLIAVLAVNAVLLAAVLIWWMRPVAAPVPSEPIAAPAAPPPPASPRPLVKLEPLPTPAVPKLASPPPAPRADVAPTPAKPSPPPAAPPPAPPAPRIGTPGIQPAPPVAARPAAPAAPPESSGLRVEALIYADVPAERMVFINGRRYREGDSIDGRLKIEEIREEGVELSDQGRRFTLRVSR